MSTCKKTTKKIFRLCSQNTGKCYAEVKTNSIKAALRAFEKLYKNSTWGLGVTWYVEEITENNSRLHRDIIFAVDLAFEDKK